MIRQLRLLLRALFPSGDGLAAKTVKGGMWVGALNVSDRFLQLLLLLVLANLIGPTELGLFGIALVVLSGVRRFSELGINQSLIYEREDNVDHMLNTAWLLEIARTGIVALTLFVIANPLANLLGAPAAAPLIQVIGLGRLFIGFRNPGVVYFQKDLQFHKQFGYVMTGSVLRFVVGIGFAYLVAPTAMALVVAFVVADAFKMLASYWFHDFRPRPDFEWDAARGMISYGKWITANSILYFLYSEGDDLLVSGILTPAALGFYQLAYNFSNAPATEVTHVISQVTFPAYSKLQDDTAGLREGFHRTLQVTTFISFPLALGLLAVTPVFVRAFLPDYTQMILTMQILAVFGLTRSAVATFGPVWKAVGRPDLVAKFSTVRVVLLAIILPAVLWLSRPFPEPAFFGLTGIEAASLVILGVQLFPMVEIDLYYLRRTVETTYGRIARDIAYPLAASATMCATVMAADAVLPLSPIVRFVVLVLIGVVTYAALVLVLDRFGWGMSRNVKTMVASVSN